MSVIETEIWKKNPDRPGTLIFDKQRAARDIFDDLKAHLIADGRMPDEYFLFDAHGNWKDGALFPKDADILCDVNYGGSEGIYLDISVKYKKEVYEYNEESKGWGWHNRTVIEHFATGKTLADSIDDLDRMSLVSSSVTAAFYGNKAEVMERYTRIENGEETPLFPPPDEVENTAAHDPIIGFTPVEPENEQHAALLDRLGNNLSDYHDMLMGFGKREIIEMAGKASAMEDAYVHMASCTYEEKELDFLLKFQDPLTVVADALNERHTGLDEVADIIFDLGGKEDALQCYPLTEEAKREIENEAPAETRQAPEQAAEKEKPKTLAEKMAAANEKVKARDAQNNGTKPHKRGERE